MTSLREEHEILVAALTKPGFALLNEMTPEKMDLLHMAVGIATEAGELLDAVKAHAIYGKPIDLQNTVEELGDMEFYLQGLRKNLGISRENTLSENIRKLKIRYNKGSYSNQQAIERADKEQSFAACGAMFGSASEIFRCMLPNGHEGEHANQFGDSWDQEKLNNEGGNQ